MIEIKEFVKVEMRTLFVDFILNNVMRMVAGKRFYGDGTEQDADARRVWHLIAEVVECAGAGNAADYFPVLCWVTNYERRVKKVADEFLQGLVDEKRVAKEKVMILAGTDTLTGTLEWAIPNLLNHPEILRKARTEIDNILGTCHKVTQSDRELLNVNKHANTPVFWLDQRFLED